MQPNDSLFHGPRTRAARRASLQIDSATVSTDSSPRNSPTSPSLSRPRTITPANLSALDESTPRAVALSAPRRKASRASAQSDKAKRKRSRVTPEQLVHLERIFAQDRSPTAAKRKEISDLLGMQERQTQIWFQNRRAKAKNQDGKLKTGRGSPGDSPPGTPPELGNASELDLSAFVHEDHPVTFIPCTELTIGNWRRITTSQASQDLDLLAYICEAKQCLTWFILSAGCGFKMEIPYRTISRTSLSPANGQATLGHGQGLASFYLSETPLFFLESLVPSPHGPPTRTWQTCADWTEHEQATKVRRHDLVGGLGQLAQILRTIDPIQMPQASYRPEITPPLQLPLPPMASISTAPPPPMGIPFPESGGLDAALTPVQSFHNRKRSYSGPPAIPALSAFGPSFQPQYMQPSGRPSSLQFPLYANQPMYYHAALPTPAHPSPPPMPEFPTAPLPRPFVPHLQSSARPPLSFDEHPEDIRRFSSGSSAQSFGSVSPPLLTQPFTPTLPHTPVSATIRTASDSASILGVDLGQSLHEMGIEAAMVDRMSSGYGSVHHDMRRDSSHGRPTSSSGYPVRPASSGDNGSSLEAAFYHHFEHIIPCSPHDY